MCCMSRSNNQEGDPKGERTSFIFGGGDAGTSLQVLLSLQEDCFAGTSFCAKFLLQREILIKSEDAVSSREPQIRNNFNLLLT